MSFDLSEYVDVAERIAIFYAKYPEGTLQSELVYTEGGWLCTGFAYRAPDDPRPGVGHAFEPVPGKTPYTKDSEVMNAETSAWGRAIVACGFATKKIASAEEVRARQNSGEPSRADAPPTSERDPSAPSHPSAGASPEHPVAKARAAAVAAKVARTPQDDGESANVVVTFGKHKGKPLGELPTAYLEWLVKNFEARDAEQRRILAAANFLLGGGPEPDSFPDDDIPF